MITLKPKRRFSALLAQRERKAHELATVHPLRLTRSQVGLATGMKMGYPL
jgi:hypothetical protein